MLTKWEDVYPRLDDVFIPGS